MSISVCRKVMIMAAKAIRILVACGTAIATATVVATKLKEVFKKLGVPLTVVQCKASEVSGKVMVFQPHVIVATTPVSEGAARGVPVVNGVPFLTGIGEQETIDKILEIVGIKK